MKDYLKKTIQTYNQDAGKYEASSASLANVQDIKKLLELTGTLAGNVLDVGCGFGRDIQALAADGREVTGIDLAQAQLAKARELHPSVQFKKMDVTNLTFEPNSFAAVWCNAVLLHLKDEDFLIALSELHRVLKDGGVLAISVKEGVGQEEKQEKFTTNGVRFYNYQTIETVTDMLTGSGFKVEGAYRVNERDRFGEQARDLNWLNFLARKTAGVQL